ncbi:MAG: NADH-quinone oxidoreductase subunit L [Anaerolineales bacterium]|uniref:NADH-quinone oxidoreductase subunit L n=1 Tax=Candidatus Villigracilis vicinus TaxID=3140679 RepID=UPI003134D4C3|nr:NADH-quinone oxidoreductase subunit L [Anaerolineales bacterium]
MHLSETVNTGFYFLAPLLVFAPVVGLLINAIFGKRFSENVVGTVASLASGTAFVVSVLLAYSVAINHGHAVSVPFAEWIHVGNLKLDWTFRVDSLSATMMLVVSGVGTLIHVYAIGYMHEDVRFKHEEGRFTRFFIFLNLFIAAMMILVSGDSYLMLFVGWEGVGLCSFLLIGFWYEMDTLGRPSWANSNAAKKAFITNRVGDFGFLMAGFLMFWYLGSFQFDEVFAAAPAIAHDSPWVIVAITLFMLVGVAGKSAQIPLYIWLPDAMAGPTPVSALIHAATMVTAGVYLVTRSASIYTLVPQAQYIVAMVGATTALFAATIAVGQYDIKKVLAYSTISQLGFMVAAVGMGAYVAGMFHLITHAFFKALLFLSAGSVILGLERGHHAHAHHAAHDEKPKGKKKPALSKVEGKEDEHGHGHDDHGEVFDPGDMRNMGGLRKTMPVTFWFYMIGTLALAGIFPFAGFWSKDEILLDASLHFKSIYGQLTLAAFFTAFYMGRQIWMVFFGEARTDAAKHAEESPKVMTVPLMVLAVLSVIGGALNLPFEGFHTLGHWLSYTIGEVEGLPLNLQVAGISTALALLAIFISWLIYGRNPLKAGQIDPLKKPLGFVFTGMENKWFVDEGYGVLILTPFKKLSQFLADVIDWRFWHDFVHDTVIAGTYNWLSEVVLSRYADQKGIDTFFNSWGSFAQWLSGNVRKIQNGFVRSYALSVLLGVVLILGYLIFK